jgi:SH3 domain-containing protein
VRVAESSGSASALRAGRAAHAGYARLPARAQATENRPLALRRPQATRLLAPVKGPGRQSARARFDDRRDNSARLSLLGLGIVLVGALIALWWTAGVRVDLAVLRGPAAFLNYQDADRPTARPGAVSAASVTRTTPEVQVVAVAPPLTNRQSVATPAVRHSAGERMRIAHTDGLGVALRNAARLDAREPRGLLEGALVTVLEWQEPDWVRVRGDDGQEGWVPAQYLLRAD